MIGRIERINIVTYNTEKIKNAVISLKPHFNSTINIMKNTSGESGTFRIPLK